MVAPPRRTRPFVRWTSCSWRSSSCGVDALLCGRRRPAGKRQDRLQVLVGEPELQTEKIVSLAGQEDLIDAAQEPESLDELVRDVDAVARLRLLGEGEEVVYDLEAVVQEVDVE